uniref:Integrase core domain containing protein n=1 Tax=Solanum tuberosum TaxID=4113 RepID=M1E104_SOLTU
MSTSQRLPKAPPLPPDYEEQSNEGTMVPKQATAYSKRGKSKSVAPSQHLVNESSEDEYNPETSSASGASASSSDADSIGDAKDPPNTRFEPVHSAT